MSAHANIHVTKTHLSPHLERVQAGEKITIARAGKPIARAGVRRRHAAGGPEAVRMLIW